MRRRQPLDEVLARIAAAQAEDLARWKHAEDYAWGIVFGAYSALARIASDRDRVRLDAVYDRWDKWRRAAEETRT